MTVSLDRDVEPAHARITASYRLKPSEAIAVLAGAFVEVEVTASGVIFRVRR